MSKLTKEEVISTLENALSKQQNKAVTIEQKGSWYKIDGGKSIRFSELEAMLEGVTNELSAPQSATTKVAPTVKKTAKPAPVTNSQGGKTPKALWREKLASQSGKTTLPRGF